MNVRRVSTKNKLLFPQRLEPAYFVGRSGTAEAVPFPSLLMKSFPGSLMKAKC